MKKLLKYIICFSIFLFFIICVNVKGVSALSKSEVENLKDRDYVEVIKKSKIYLTKDNNFEKIQNAVILNEGTKDDRITVGTRLQVMKVKKTCYVKINMKDVYYVWVNYNGVDCLVHYSNLEKVSLTEEEKKLINDFLEKEDVKKIIAGKANKLEDDKLIEITEEASEIFIKTGNEEVNQAMTKGKQELENRGYQLESQSDGGTKIIDKNGEVVGETEGGDTVSNVSSTIYKLPSKKDTETAGGSIDNVIDDADEFIDQGSVTYDQSDLISVSNTIYNILLIAGIMIAVIVGGIIGIKLMVSGIEGKVEAKKLLVPYVVGCIVIFGGFGIWKIIVTILQAM